MIWHFIIDRRSELDVLYGIAIGQNKFKILINGRERNRDYLCRKFTYE